jgi:hypothetical protein
MARPVVEARNRAPRGSLSARTREAPALDIAAPIDVRVAEDNAFTELARAIGLVGEISADVSRRSVAMQLEQQAADDEAAVARDAAFGLVDQERRKKSRAYAQAADRITTISAGTKAGFDIEQQFEAWRRENPEADEKAAASKLDELIGGFLRPDGETPNPLLADGRAASVVIGNLQELRLRILDKDTDDLLKAKVERGTLAATDQLVGVVLQNKGAKPGDYLALHAQLKALGLSGSEINRIVAETAKSAAEQLGSSQPISALPDKWADGTPSVKFTAEFGDDLKATGEKLDADAEQKRIEQLSDARIAWVSRMRSRADTGVGLSQKDIDYAQSIGVAEGTIIGINDSAANARTRIAEKRERELEKARERAAIRFNALAGNQWMNSPQENGKVLDEVFSQLKTVGERHRFVIQQAQRGMLPPSYRRFLSAPPTDTANFNVWLKNVKQLRSVNPSLYASLPDIARARAEAFESLMKTGSFTPEQALGRVSTVDRQKGRDMKRVLGKKAVDNILDPPGLGDFRGSLLARRKAEQVYEAFASLPDVDDDEAVEMARGSFWTNHFVADGRVYNRSVIPHEDALGWIKAKVAGEMKVDADDIVVAQDPNRPVLWIRRNGSAAQTAVSADQFREWWYADDNRERREQAEQNRRRSAVITYGQSRQRAGIQPKL